MKIISRLRKIADYADTFGPSDNPAGILLNNPYDYQDYKKEPQNITLGPNLDKTWRFIGNDTASSNDQWVSEWTLR